MSNENVASSSTHTSRYPPASATVSASHASAASISQRSMSSVLATLRDKSVVVEGGGDHTAEAREIDRKMRILEQLKMARRLRAVLEHASEEADSKSIEEARKILLRHRKDINQLVSLTEAVRGNYTLDNYNDCTIQSDIRDNEHESKVKKAKKVLRNHLWDMAKERNPELKKRAKIEKTSSPPEAEPSLNKEEKKRSNDDDALYGNDFQVLGNVATKKVKPDRDTKSSQKRSLKSNTKSHKNTAVKVSSSMKKKSKAVTENWQNKHLSPSTTQSENNAQLLPQKKNVHIKEPWNAKHTAASSFTDSSKNNATTQVEFSASGIVPSAEDVTVSKTDEKRKHSKPDVPKASNKSISTPRRNRSKAKTQPRKCHNCNVTKTSYLRCHFWFMNGTKCGKIYCKDCMTSKYSLKDFGSVVSDDWHCPACLGACQCSPCVKQRERTERRAAASDRRSTARTSAGFYSFGM